MSLLLTQAAATLRAGIAPGWSRAASDCTTTSATGHAPPSASVQRLLEGRAEGWGPTEGLQGERFYTAFSRSSRSGWTVVAGIRREVIDAPLREAYVSLAAGIALLLVLGIAASLIASRTVTRPIDALREAARAYGRGRTFEVPQTRLPELRELAQALSLAQNACDGMLERERDTRASAEAANRSKDEFLAMLGHELRNPLAAIANGAVVLDRVVPPEHTVARRMTEMVQRQAGHLSRLMDDLLDVGRVATGKIMLDRVPVDLSKVVNHAVSAFASTGRLDRHRVEVDARPVWVMADAARMEQVCSNLLGNALKFTPAGRRIRIVVTEERGEAVCAVHDEGVGMEPELAAKVFDLFVQGSQLSDRSQGGLGIGLTLVRRLVELHGGTVEAYSDGSDQGSSFVVRLPAIEPPRHTPREQPVAAAPCRVLIVEDNADTRLSLRALLSLQGHLVHEAVDGPTGVAAFDSHQPDVVLVDIGLPGFDGYEVAKRIRAHHGGTPRLIALTGYGLESDAQRARDAGFDVHLVKPVGERVLARALGAAVHPHGAPVGEG